MNKVLIGLFLAVSFSAFANSNVENDSIRESLIIHIPQLRYCYQPEFERAQNVEQLQGSIILAFEIGANGTVLNTEISSDDITSDKTIDCMKNVIHGIEFQSPNEGKIIKVHQSMNLYPKKN